MNKRALILVFLFALVFTGCTVEENRVNPVRDSILFEGEEPDFLPPTPVQQMKDKRKQRLEKRIKGIYVSGYTAGNPKRMDTILQLLQATELNAVVIDMKADNGNVTYSSRALEHYGMKQQGSPVIPQVQSLLKGLEKNGVYTIARIVTFKDPVTSRAYPSSSIKTKTGALWQDRKNNTWLNPFRESAWDIPLAIAREAATFGFDEIQFDYVRFPENAAALEKEADLSNPHGWSKSEAISRFLQRARKELKPYGVVVSADVFGLTTSVRDDMGIGQNWKVLAPGVDIICPMIYPSHYSNGIYGLPHPDLKPGALVKKALSDGLDKNRRLQSQGLKPARIRPWFQAFTATWIQPHQTYGKRQIEEQIHAARSLGISEYLLWNPSSRYPDLAG